MIIIDEIVDYANKRVDTLYDDADSFIGDQDDQDDFYDHYELVHPIVERLGFGTFIKGNHKHAYIKL